jgi:hypothetical protein
MDNTTKNNITRRGLITTLFGSILGLVGITSKTQIKQENPPGSYGNGNYGGC